MQPCSELSLTCIAGTPHQCGLIYGERFRPLLRGFLHFAMPWIPSNQRYARQCREHIRRDAQTSAAFMKGVAKSSGLELNNVSYYTALELPIELYADASHPVAEGYSLIAEELLKNDFVKSFKARDAKQ